MIDVLLNILVGFGALAALTTILILVYAALVVARDLRGRWPE